jgi:hypothetical protein
MASHYAKTTWTVFTLIALQKFVSMWLEIVFKMSDMELDCTPPDIKEGNKMNIENFH